MDPANLPPPGDGLEGATPVTARRSHSGLENTNPVYNRPSASIVKSGPCFNTRVNPISRAQAAA